MTIVKPPTFDELVQTYGSLKAAIQHLIEAGSTPEEIEWKLGIPYYLINLYMAGAQLKNPTPFSEVVRIYERLAVIRSKKGKETELTKLFKTEGLDLEMKARLALGTVSEENLKVGPGIIERAVCLATGEPPRKGHREIRDSARNRRNREKI